MFFFFFQLERTALHYAMGVPSVEVLSNILITAGAKRIVKDLVSHFYRITNALYTHTHTHIAELIFWTFRNLGSPRITLWINLILNDFKKKKNPWSCKWYDAEHLHRFRNYTIHTLIYSCIPLRILRCMLRKGRRKAG